MEIKEIENLENKKAQAIHISNQEQELIETLKNNAHFLENNLQLYVIENPKLSEESKEYISYIMKSKDGPWNYTALNDIKEAEDHDDMGEIHIIFQDYITNRKGPQIHIYRIQGNREIRSKVLQKRKERKAEAIQNILDGTNDGISVINYTYPNQKCVVSVNKVGVPTLYFLTEKREYHKNIHKANCPDGICLGGAYFIRNEISKTIIISGKSGSYKKIPDDCYEAIKIMIKKTYPEYEVNIIEPEDEE